MKENKGKNIIIGVLSIIIVILGSLLTYSYVFKDSNESGLNNNESGLNNAEEGETSTINLKMFEKVIDEELYVLFGYKSLSEVSNKRKLTLVFNLLEEKYSYNSNDVNTYLNSVSRRKVEEVFKGTVLANLGINHENIDIYEVNDSFYNRINNYMSKRNLFMPGCVAKKIVSYNQDGNRYTVDLKYLFTNNADNGDRGQFAYGSYVYGTESEKIVEVYRYNDNFDLQVLVPDLQKYLDDNYDIIKDKLDTYHYVFEVKNNEVKLVDFSVVNS